MIALDQRTLDKERFITGIPRTWNSVDAEAIAYNFEILAMCAFYLAGEDQMGLKEMVEFDLDITIEEFDPVSTYEKCYSELIDIVCGYNYYITDNNLSESLVKITVDEEKTNLLDSSGGYMIYKITEK